MTISIEFTPSQKLGPGAKVYGWGKITIGPIWINYSVLATNTNAHGFFISLPSEKNPKHNPNDPQSKAYYPKVGFLDRETQSELEQRIAPLVQQALINAQGGGGMNANYQGQQAQYQQQQYANQAQQQPPVPAYIPQNNQPQAQVQQEQQVPPARPATNVTMGAGMRKPNPNVPPAGARPNPMNNPMMRK